MPTATFENLAPAKRDQFIQAALAEFAAHNYDVASVNRIVKALGIARGSVYQYFADKLDLWQYLRLHAQAQKMAFLGDVRREDYATFWEHYRALYHKGVHFDVAHPLCSRLLYRISYQENSPSVQPYLQAWKQEAKQVLTAWVAAEQANGQIKTTISAELAGHYLLSMSMGIADWLQDRYAIDDNMAQGRPMLGDDLTDYYTAIDELIALLQQSLQP